MTTLHRLKVLPTHFEGIVAGEKTFDVRLDDPGYQAGDHVLLREWDPDVECACRETSRFHLEGCARYTSRERFARIGWVTASTPKVGSADGGWNGNGFVVFSLCDVVEPVEQLIDAGVDPTEFEVPIEARQMEPVDSREGIARVAAASRGGDER